MINKYSRIYIAGHYGLVGSAILRRLKKEGYKDVIFRTRKQLDLKDQNKVFNFLKKQKPDFIFIAAAKVGGILSNSRNKADFITNFGRYLLKSLVILGIHKIQQQEIQTFEKNRKKLRYL